MNKPTFPRKKWRRRRRLAITLTHFLTTLSRQKPFRDEKVRRISDAVRGDCYENDLKLSIAIDRLMRDL